MKKIVRNGGTALVLLFLGYHNAHAQETATYTYDAKGRVVSVTRSGGPASGTTTSYNYDPADNRQNVTVSNSPNGAGRDRYSGATTGATHYVVVPLNGYTLIPTL